MKKQSDRHHRPLRLEVGDKVFLRTTTLPWKRQFGKLSSTFIGPLVVTHKVGDQDVRLNLPSSCRLSNCFHVEKMKECHPDIPAATEAELHAWFCHDNFERPIENNRVLHFIHNERVDAGQQQFLVEWRGLPFEESCWVPTSDFDADHPVVKHWNGRRDRCLSLRSRGAAQL